MYRKLLASGITVSMLLIGSNVAHAEDNQVNEHIFIKGADLNGTQLEETKEQYTNAAISEGVQDSNIKVASVESVTGEKALSGLVDKAKSLDTQENRNFLQKIWDFIVSFFQWIYDSVMRLINF
ncbi:DUF1002 domain-containing protein [Staphylococcus pseudintermedius]|nr:DUF1002 domain-containing protein [Staphylococcus pseudintermedius]